MLASWMGLLIIVPILLLIDILSFLTLSSGRIIKKKTWIRNLKLVHLSLSLLSYCTLFLTFINRNHFAENSNIGRMLFMGFLVSLIWIPRILVIGFSNAGFYLRKFSAKGARLVNNSGIALSVILICLVLWGSFIGRFNFDYKEIEIEYNNLPPELEGFKIVQLSDMHLSSFHRHNKKLRSVIDRISSLDADIVVNTGDFVSFAWNEMDPFTEIISGTKSKYGNFAIPGNHDAGIYHPYYNETERLNNVLKMDKLISDAGYIQIKDSSLIINIDSLKLRIAGLITRGRVPDIIFGDLEAALDKGEDADFTILLSHDPNHWYRELQDSDRIQLTLSGHTHGMQIGLETGAIKWSPAARLYPAWGGLYGNNNNYLYVNRGLGTISLPYRIGMPPEITIITLKSYPKT